VAVTCAFGLAVALVVPVAFVLAVLLYGVTAPFDRNQRLLHGFVCRLCHGFLHLNPAWRVRVEGRDRIPRGPAVLVANHQSMTDILATMGLFRQFKYVSKGSLFALPLVGWVMRLLRYVRLERGRPHSTRRMLEDCRAWLRRGVPVLLFPEGTYAPTEVLLHFKPGAFLLAMEEKVPVVPVLLSGTRALMEGDGPWLAPRARVTVRVLEPFLVPAGKDAAQMAVETRALFARELQRPLLPPAGPTAREAGRGRTPG
jgi:1-acyl-sn-glycerol-3-phosphate acyltransferase